MASMHNILGSGLKIFGYFRYFSSDTLFIGSLFILILAFSLYFGRGRLVSIILAFYPTTLIYKTFPYIDKLIVLKGDFAQVINELLVFSIILVLITIIIDRFIKADGNTSILRLSFLSLAFVLLIIVFSYTTINYDVLHNYSEQFDSLFTQNRLIWWNLVPVALLMLV